MQSAATTRSCRIQNYSSQTLLTGSVRESESDLESNPDPNQAKESPQTEQGDRPQRTKRLPARFRQNPADVTIFIQDDTADHSPLPPFTTSRRKELNGLLKSGVFEVVDITDIPQGIRIFNSRFVDEIKNPGTASAFKKSRLVVQAYKDTEKDMVLTQSPTIQRVSQRLILTITVILPGYSLYLRDIT